MSDHQTYREWSAAYVLGALESSERRNFEAGAVFQRLRDRAVEFHSSAKINSLADALDRLDFEEALVVLETLTDPPEPDGGHPSR